jgi:hypothetical protein
VAATIGAAALAAEADALERAVVDGQPWQPLLQTLRPSLAALMEGLQAHFAAQDFDVSSQPVGDSDPAACPDPAGKAVSATWNDADAAQLDRLEALLASDDPAAIECLEDGPARWHALLDSAHAGVADSVRRFDFPQALQQLRHWRAQGLVQGLPQSGGPVSS